MLSFQPPLDHNNWLKKNRAQINFSPNQLKIKGIEIPLGSEASGELNIYSVDNIQLPPRTAVSCTARSSPSEQPKETLYQVIPTEEVIPGDEEVILVASVVKKKPKIPVEELPPKPSPKSTPVTIRFTPETQQIINVAMDLESAERAKHLPNPELLEFGKIRSKSLDIETKGQRSSDFSLGPAKRPNLASRGSKDDTETINKSKKVSTKDPKIKDLDLTSVDEKNDMETLQIELKLESKTIDLEEKSQKL